jgi:hypothetical protein
MVEDQSPPNPTANGAGVIIAVAWVAVRSLSDDTDQALIELSLRFMAMAGWVGGWVSGCEGWGAAAVCVERRADGTKKVKGFFSTNERRRAS